MRMVIEVSDEFKELVTAVEALVPAVAEEGVRGAGGKAVDYARVEVKVARIVTASTTSRSQHLVGAPIVRDRADREFLARSAATRVGSGVLP